MSHGRKGPIAVSIQELSVTSWCKNSFSLRPLSAYSFTDYILGDSDKVSPLTKIHCPSMKSDSMIMSIVVCLDCSCSPLAICRRISQIIIDTLKRQFLCLFSHIFKKSCETITPFFTNSYATTSIIFETFIIRICTSLNHIYPRFVFRSITQAMYKTSFNKKFSFKTTTRCYSAGFQVRGLDSSSVSTNTFTCPTGLIIFSVFSTFNNCKTIKNLVSKVFKVSGWHNNLQAKGNKQIIKKRKVECLSLCLIRP